MSNEKIEIPTIDCMKKAIWAAVKTKTNFKRSTYLHDGDSKQNETDFQTTYGPWTDGIMFTENFSNNENPETINTQIVLNKICVDVPELNITDGKVSGGITDDFLNSIEPKRDTITDLNGSFINKDATDEVAEIETHEVQVFEAHTLGKYLMTLQNNTSAKDSRIETIVKDLYNVQDGTKIPDSKDIGKDSVLSFGVDLRDVIYGNNGSISEPEESTILYDLYGKHGQEGNKNNNVGGIKGDIYGSDIENINKPKENSIKWISQQTIMENGILTEEIDYIFYDSIVNSLPEFINSNYFTVDKFGQQIKYKIIKSSTNLTLDDCIGTAIGYINQQPIHMKYVENEENYPTLKKISIQYIDENGIIKNEKYEIINPN